MPRYFYKAKSLKGKTVEGLLSAMNKSELARLLKGKNLILVSAKRTFEKNKRLDLDIPFFNRVSLTEKLMFTRNLKVMISAGVSLPRALETLSVQTKNRKLSKALLSIREEIIKGTAFSDALSRHPKIFSELFFNMVKAGEASGKLEDVLAVLARQIARRHELESKIKGALAYPAVIILAMLGIGAGMLVFVVPKISATFKELKIALPVTTRFVINIGETMAHRWYLFLLGLFFLIFAISRLLKTKAGIRAFSWLSIKVPIFSSITKKANSARILRTLSSLISAGVPLTSSLGIIFNASNNVYYKETIEAAIERVKSGDKLSEVWMDYKNIYPAVVVQMIAVGEETGQTVEVLEKLADFFEQEVANATCNLTAVIEPLVMLLVGGAVGFFAISMVQPMYSMLEAIK